MDCRVKPGNATLLHAERHKPQFAVAVGDQQQHRLSCRPSSTGRRVFLMSAALPTASCATSTMTSPAESRFFGGVRTAIDAGDDDALDAVLDLVLAAQILAQGPRDRGRAPFASPAFRRALPWSWRRACCAFSVSSRRPSVTFLVSSLPLRMMITLDILADSGIGDDARGDPLDP